MLCGSETHEECVAFFPFAVVVLLLVLSALCALWFVCWRRWNSLDSHGWRRADSFDAEDDEGVGRSTVDVVEHEGLQAADDAPLQNSEETVWGSNQEGERSTGGWIARCMRRFNLHGARLRQVLRVTSAEFFYHAPHPSSPLPSLPASRPPFAALTASTRHDHPYVRGTVSVVTTTADSSESSIGSDTAQDTLHFLCQTECLGVDATERARAVGHSTAAIRPPCRAFTPHVLPQIIDYNTDFAFVLEDEDCEFLNNTDSDSQHINDSDENTMRTLASSLTASGNAAINTLSFPFKASRTSHTHSTEGISYCETNERRCCDKKNDSGAAAGVRVGVPHVETAIFDTSANACVVGPQRAPPPPMDSGITVGLFEPPQRPYSSTRSTSEAAESSAVSHLSGLDCYVSPPANSDTATPASLCGSGSCLPPYIPTLAALPDSLSLRDDLDQEGEVAAEEFDWTRQSRSCLLATQQQQKHQLGRVQQQMQMVRPPPQALTRAPRKRTISHYSEPWQPVLVPQDAPQLVAAAAATTVLPIETPAAVAAVLRRSSPLPWRCPLAELGGVLADELGDVMFVDCESAPGNQIEETGRIFSGPSSSASSPVISATENGLASDTGTQATFFSAAMRNEFSCISNDGLIGLATVGSPAALAIPPRPESPLFTIFTPVAGIGETGIGKRELGLHDRASPSPSCNMSGLPLSLSYEERSLLIKNQGWLFPLIDGVDLIEQKGIDEGETNRICDGAASDKAKS
ncbi:hypothetical protein ABL78_0652 [Leptomonas seymouri]|uniref:Uncharacterized protein n=1 Tax=Leptomonas seymouri TaxID=5684 RepID=A0A0N1PFH2_LEPSE|nr:hypothetical protein ABL78_0652 [Leptomonas seymouri]|eukprot:KPI90270.1 hypothetical protein ABL78_0652 [Leptomonas seymouri]